jgi:hypothetical protein
MVTTNKDFGLRVGGFMAKDLEFWLTICEEYNYRFFSGVPCAELAPLYAGMQSNIMHYIPAANENIALNLAAGSRISGYNSGILIGPSLIEKLDFTVLDTFSVPVLIITTVSNKKGLYANNNLDEVINYMNSKGKAGVFLYEAIHSD